MGRRRRIDAFVERESLLLTALPSLVHEKGYEPIGRMRGYRRSDLPDRTRYLQHAPGHTAMANASQLHGGSDCGAARRLQRDVEEP
jgi:hypothetical protein